MSVNATTVDTELFHSCARIRVAGSRAGGAVAPITRLRPRGGVFVYDRSAMCLPAAGNVVNRSDFGPLAFTDTAIRPA